MIDLAISSSDCHSTVGISVSLLLWRIASIWRRMINTSCIISFHREIFLPSNFRISTPLQDVQAIILVGVIVWAAPFLQLIFPSSYVVASELQVTLIPLCCMCLGRLVCDDGPPNAEASMDVTMELASKHMIEIQSNVPTCSREYIERDKLYYRLRR